MEKLKIYSIENNLLSVKSTNWEYLFIQTKQTMVNYLEEVSKIHKSDYLSEDEPFENLPSDCFSELVHLVILLWYPFYYDLSRIVQEKIDNELQGILFELNLSEENDLRTL